MKFIPVKPNMHAIVDDDAFPTFSRYSWRLRNGYAVRFSADTTVSMHREIYPPPSGLETDHTNHDRLDNRRSNLRLVSRTLNNANRRIGKNNTSGFKGVHYALKSGRWRAVITNQGKKHHLGFYPDKRTAAVAYNTAATQLWGDHASLNPV
jgi:hypothetical protein